MKGVYDLPEDMGEQIGNNTIDTGIKSYRERVDELCGAIDQQIAYLDNYMNDLKLYDAQSWEYYSQEFQNIVDEYNLYKNKAYGVLSTAADEFSKQEHINNLQYVLDYSQNLVGTLEQQFSGSAPTDIPMSDIGVPNGGQTAMVTNGNGNGEDVIVMEEAGAIRGWWDGLSDSTKGMMKAAGLALTVWGGRKLFNYAMENWKKASFEDRITVEEPEEDFEVEV
jgi:hypothetical protein